MMDFVFCTDKNYLKGYGVLMLSILRFAPPPQQQLRFHVLSDDLDEADKALLQGIAVRREGTEVRFYEPARLLSAETLAIIERGAESIKNHITKTGYYRLLAADLLPRDIHRALYIDGDIVCAGSLEPLFNTDLKGCPVGMCFDSAAAWLWTYNILGYPPQDGYFNSGVMLFDLDAWRKEGLGKTMIGYLGANAKKRQRHDQDVINPVLHGRIFQIDFSYNLIPHYLYVFYWLEEERNGYLAYATQCIPKEKWPDVLSAVESPRLVHFLAGIKPWHRECRHPFAPVWRRFYAQSPWAAEPLQWRNPPTIKARIKRALRPPLERLNLIAPQPAAIPYPQEAYASAQRVMDELSRQSAVGSRQL